MSQQYRPNGSFTLLPPVIKNLLIINVIFFLLKWVLKNIGIDLDLMLGLSYWSSPYFRIWQPITHMFMHYDFMHLLFNMFALWMFGATVENVLGTKRFLILYFVSGFGAAILQFVLSILLNMPFGILIGASGAVFGVMLAFAYLFPNTVIFINFLFPLKAKWFVPIYILIELFSGMRNSLGDNVAHFAHVGGALFAYLLMLYWKKNRTIYIR